MCYGEFQILEVDTWTRNPILFDIGTFCYPFIDKRTDKTHIKRVPIPRYWTHTQILEYVIFKKIL